MYLDKNKIINSLTKEDVIKIVTSLGSGAPKIGAHGELIFQTICHNAQGGSYKLYYYHEATGKYPAKMFHCYTGCSDSFSIIELIIRANRAKNKRITFFQALGYIAQFTGYAYEVDIKNEVDDRIDDWDFINKFKKMRTSDRSIPELPEINEKILDMFYYAPHEEFLKDHISPEVIKEFEIGYWGKTNQITIPHRDFRQKLIGIRGRFLDDEDVKNIGKYAPLLVENRFLNHSLGDNLYGIHINQFKIKQCKKVLLLEAEKGVLQNHSYFGENDFALATCGSNITTNQMNLLIHYLGVEEVILGYDKMFHENGSYEELLYRNKIYNKIAPILPYCKVSLLWDKDDLLEYKQAPTDYGKDVLLELLNKKIEITLADIEEMKKEEEQYE